MDLTFILIASLTFLGIVAGFLLSIIASEELEQLTKILQYAFIIPPIALTIMLYDIIGLLSIVCGITLLAIIYFFRYNEIIFALSPIIIFFSKNNILIALLICIFAMFISTLASYDFFLKNKFYSKKSNQTKIFKSLSIHLIKKYFYFLIIAIIIQIIALGV